MKRFIHKQISVLSAMAVAGVLYAVLWQQIGAPYAAIYTDPTSKVVRLFLDHLMPGLIVIAVAAGLVSGAIAGEGRLKSASKRGAVAAVLFGAVACNAYCFSTSSVSLSGTPAGPMPPLIVVGFYAILSVVAAAFFGAIGSTPYVAFAAASAELGEYLWRRSRKLFVSVLSVVCAVALCLPAIQGAILHAKNP